MGNVGYICMLFETRISRTLRLWACSHAHEVWSKVMRILMTSCPWKAPPLSLGFALWTMVQIGEESLDIMEPRYTQGFLCAEKSIHCTTNNGNANLVFEYTLHDI